MPWPSHSSTIITSRTVELVESFKHRQNIMDDKLNTTYKLCQQKLFVVCKLKVLSVADRLLRLFRSHIESVLLSLSSICCFTMLTSLQLPQTCTDSNITRLSTPHRRQSHCSCAKQSSQSSNPTPNTPSTGASLCFTPAAGADPGACSSVIWVSLHNKY